MNNLDREQSTQLLLQLYCRERSRLSEKDRPLFDKLLNLIEEVSEVRTPIALVLDTMLVAALSIIALHPKTHTKLALEVALVIAEAGIESRS